MLARMSSLTLEMAQVNCGALPPAGPYVQHLHYTLRGREFLVQGTVYRLHMGTFLRKCDFGWKSDRSSTSAARLGEIGFGGCSLTPQASDCGFDYIPWIEKPMDTNAVGYAPLSKIGSHSGQRAPRGYGLIRSSVRSGDGAGYLMNSERDPSWSSTSEGRTRGIGRVRSRICWLPGGVREHKRCD